MNSNGIPAFVTLFVKSALYNKQCLSLQTFTSLHSILAQHEMLPIDFKKLLSFLHPKLPYHTYALLLSNANIFSSYWAIHSHYNYHTHSQTHTSTHTVGLISSPFLTTYLNSIHQQAHMKFILIWSLLPLNSDKRWNLKRVWR